MIKLLGAGMVLLSCTGMGFFISEKYKMRIAQLKELRRHMNILYGEIQYGASELPEALKSVASRNHGDITAFFEWASTEASKLEGSRFSSIWKHAIEEKLKDTCLKKEDKQLLQRLGDNLGFLDQKTQLSTMELYIHSLEDNIEEGTKEMKEKVRLYHMLGVLGGIFITIVML